MARYKKIDPRIWGDSRFRALSAAQPNAQTLWLFILTGPHTTIIPGLSSVGESGLSERLRWPSKAFRDAFREGIRQGLFQHDQNAPLLWVPNVIKYDPPNAPNVVKAWRLVWDELPDCALKMSAYQRLKAFANGMGNAFADAFADAVAMPLAMPLPIPEPEPEPYTEPEKEPYEKESKRKNAAVAAPRVWTPEALAVIAHVNEVTGRKYEQPTKEIESRIAALGGGTEAVDKCKRFVTWQWERAGKARDPVEQRGWVNNATPFRGPTWDRDFPTMAAADESPNLNDYSKMDDTEAWTNGV